MPIILNDSFITGLVSGGLPDSTISTLNILDGAVIYAKLLTADWTTNVGGYTKLAGGIIIQWGLGISNAAANVGFKTNTATFPIAFPTACLAVQQGIRPADAISLNYGAIPMATTFTTTNFLSAFYKTTGNGTFEGYYVAVGY